MIEVSVYSGRAFKAGATLAIKHRLFIPGWCLLPTLNYHIADQRSAERDGARIAIAFESQTPVALVFFDGECEVMAFCRLDKRRKGYASACLKKLNLPEGVSADTGIEGSESFWSRNNIPCDFL